MLTFIAREANQEIHFMTQYTIDFLQHKNGNGKHGRPDERNLAGDLKHWLADLVPPRPCAKSNCARSASCAPRSIALPGRRACLRQRSVSRAN
jgi:hypothetical protein